jgi:hypothetical protein
MPTKLSTTIKKIESVPNPDNARLIFEFHKFMKSNGSSERHQNNNLKAIISYANYLGASVTCVSINKSQEVLSFLDTKIKTNEEDPDQKWITNLRARVNLVPLFKPIFIIRVVKMSVLEQERDYDPMQVFTYALKASESQRQYPRFKPFL